MKHILHKPSEEQQLIIDNLIKYNIKVNCIAGSGKTTTVLHICLKYPNLNILLLTYNSKLRKETIDRVNSAHINNCEVHTYHSFNTKYYEACDYTDNGLNNTLKKKIIAYTKFKYDIIVFDECQDLTLLYYEFIQKILYDNNNEDIHLCVLGDIKQCIYKYNLADERFLILAEKLYNTKYKWIDCNLSISYRLTNEIANFINKCILKEDKILTCKQGNKPSYLICDNFDVNKIYKKINELLKKYNPYDIFILAPSVKKPLSDNPNGNNTGSPVCRLANYLSGKKIPIYVPSSDDEKIDNDIIKGKILFCTFHQSKGLEKEVVIIFNFDSSYFDYYDKQISKDICPNTIYVALTRCKEELIIIHSKSKCYLNFIDSQLLPKYVDFKYDKNPKIEPYMMKSEKSIYVAVTNYIKNLSTILIKNCIDKIEKINLDQPDKIKINLPVKIKQNNFYESVAEINGVAIIAHIEYKTTKKMTILNMLIKDELRMKSLGLKIGKFNLNNYKLCDLLKLATIYCAYMSGYIFQTKQIINYNWLKEKDILPVCDRYIKKVNTTNILYEVPVFGDHNGTILSGAIDAIDLDNFIVYEFKCTKTLLNDHILQLIIYMYLFNFTVDKYQIFGINYFSKNEKYNIFKSFSFHVDITNKINFIIENIKKFKFIIWNLLDNTMYQITKNDKIINDIMNDIYKYKNSKEEVDDDTFLNSAHKILDKYNPRTS